ncbi:MAG: diguanylate cyclase [Helicobacteraceae bacterium]|nr:diguanylate cyclase [Candidatus Sulfurimonas ponti]MBL6973202.1 diguanylate cyclase [Sulfurimonas sp.]
MKKIENTTLYIQLVVGVLLLAIFGLISNYYIQLISIEQHTFYNVPDYEKRFTEYKDTEANKITSYLELLKEKKQLQSLFKESNREKLYEVSKPIFDHLNNNSDITHFYFIKPSGEVLLRVHDKYRYSDIVHRYTFIKAKENLIPYHGLEFGMKKNYTLRVVHPWIVDGELLGFIELGKEVDKVINSLSGELGIEIYFAVKKSVFDNSPKFVQERLQKLQSTDTQYIVYQTTDIPKNINWLINGNDKFNWVEIGEQVYISHTDYLKDISGDNLGTILYLVNITKEYTGFTATIWRYGIIMAFGTFLMLVIGFVFARQSQHRINNILESLDIERKNVENLFNEQKHLLSLFDKSDSILFKWNNDEHWSIEYVSNNVEKLFEYTKEEFLNKKIVYASCIHKEDIKTVLQEVQSIKKANLDFLKHDPYRIVTKSGKVKWVIDYTVTQKDDSGAIKHFIGYIMDITEQKNKEQEIQDKLQKFINTQSSIVILTDGKTLQFANKTFLEFFGYRDLEHFKKHYECICHRFVEQENFFHLGKVKEGEAHWIESLLNLSGRQRVVSMLSDSATPHAFSVSINKYEDVYYVVTFTDISDTMVEKLELAKEATIDTLTGLYNRVYFTKHISRILEDHKRSDMISGVIFFDIDHFKRVNDTYGHDMGDYVLSTIASLVKKYTRDSDKIIRWGGEEFIIICEIDNGKSLKDIAEHLRSVIQRHKFTNMDSITCSFGCSIHDLEYDILHTIKEADEKLYTAKDTGRNKVVY